MNLLPSVDPLTISPEIHRFLDEYQIDEYTLSNLAKQQGDLLLIRRFPTEDRSFLKRMQENQFYSRWFSEKYSIFEPEIGWRRIEQDLQIRFTEPNPQNAVLPDAKFIEVADHILQNWKERATESNGFSSFVLRLLLLSHFTGVPLVVLVTGEKDMGKSTFTRYLVNRATDQLESNYAVTYFDCDIGQCEFAMSGCLSYVHLQSPLFGPPCSHIRSNP